MQIEQLEVHEDERGILVEAFKFPKDGQVFSVIANPNETRGNHYHTRKIEEFLVIYGSATIEARDRETGHKMKVEVSGTNPLRVKIMPNHTHAITASSQGAVFIVWANEIFDKKDPDTFGEEL